MNLTIGQILGGITGIVVLLSVCIEITPIKINPISNFLAWFGRKMNRDLMTGIKTLDSRVSTLEENVGTIKKEDDERDAVLCRVRILRFGDEIRRNIKHSQDSFDQVLADMDDYEQYCHFHKDFKNNKTVVTQAKIREEYARCIEENDFL